MTNLTNTTTLVSIHGNKSVTTSLMIAEVFDKNHAHILRDIQSIDCPDDFHQSNFGLIFYKDAYGREQKAYNITKDGFALLAFGYTGKKAMQFKIAYITAFNAMEQELTKNINNSDSLYFTQKKDLVQHKHTLDDEIKRLNQYLATTPEGIELAEKQQQLNICKQKIERLETKYFRYRYTLFPELDFES